MRSVNFGPPLSRCGHRRQGSDMSAWSACRRIAAIKACIGRGHRIRRHTSIAKGLAPCLSVAPLVDGSFWVMRVHTGV